MEELIKQLHRGNFSCVMAHQERIRTFNRRGIIDLYELYEQEPAFLYGAKIADKVIGKGAAALMIISGVREVYADVISESATDLFDKQGVSYRYASQVPYIVNRDKTGMCPLETRCLTSHSVDELLPIITAFVEELRRQTPQ
ncbi:MAG: DUF1893 domain-containing protein [Bacteroidia bacterium]|nr:DUF1893 domain-containing protein [Bacteroidia bacterium]